MGISQRDVIGMAYNSPALAINAAEGAYVAWERAPRLRGHPRKHASVVPGDKGAENATAEKWVISPASLRVWRISACFIPWW